MSNFMRDFADKSFLKSPVIPGQAERNAYRREQALRKMGSKYLCHPKNQILPKSSQR